jgi:hypothetical protein
VAVSTKGLQISRVIVPTVTVYVVYVELTAMFRNKATMQAGILLVNGIWVLSLQAVATVDFLAAIATSQGLSFGVS